MGWEIPRLTKCCCCVPLRIAALLIGYLSIFSACMTIAFSSWSIYKVHDTADRNQTIGQHTPQEVSKEALNLYITFAYYMFVFLVAAVLGIILVIGVHSNNPKLMRFYCNGTLFLFGLGLALVVLTCVFMGILVTVPVLKWCLTLLCCYVLVRSAYLEMEEQMKPKVQEMETLFITQIPAPQVV